MKPLSTEFTKNGLTYRIIERSGTRYFAELASEYGTVIAYETGRILIQKERDVIKGGASIHFGECELIPCNEYFGRDEFEGVFPPRMKNDVYRNFIDGNVHDNFPDVDAKSRLMDRENLKVIL